MIAYKDRLSIMKYILPLLLFLTILEASSLKSIRYGNITVTKVLRVYDAKTLIVTIKEYPKIIGQKIAIKINGISTPRINGSCENEKVLAKKAQKLTAFLIKNASVITLKNMQRGKYFRILADVYIDDNNLADILIEKNLAKKQLRKYQKNKWCKPEKESFLF